MAKTRGKQHFSVGDSDICILHSSGTIVKMEAEYDDVSHDAVTPSVVSMPAPKNAPAKELNISPWGAHNNWPQFINEKLRKCHIAKRGVLITMESIYGKGLTPFTFDYSDKTRGFNFLTPDEGKDIYDWLRKTRYKRYLKKAIRNYSTWQQTVTEFILSTDGSIVAQINALDMGRVRFTEMNSKTGIPEYVVYSSCWANGETPEIGTNAELIPLADPYADIDDLKKWIKDNSITKFAISSLVDADDREYYQDTELNAVVRAGYVDLAISIPNYKKALLENQMRIKYMVVVANDYWREKYDDWEQKSVKDKLKIREDWLSEFDRNLTGSDNALKSIQVPAFMGENGELQKYITIEEVDTGKVGSGDYIIDADAANNEILKALGVNPAILGHGATGGKIGPGSGSDIREAFMVETNTNQFAHDAIVEPLELVRDFNGWDPNVQFGFPNIELTTLDRNPTGQQTKM